MVLQTNGETSRDEFTGPSDRASGPKSQIRTRKNETNEQDALW